VQQICIANPFNCPNSLADQQDAALVSNMQHTVSQIFPGTNSLVPLVDQISTGVTAYRHVQDYQQGNISGEELAGAVSGIYATYSLATAGAFLGSCLMPGFGTVVGGYVGKVIANKIQQL